MSKQTFSSVFFLGIGGIGMSSLARWYKAQGLQVSGYDKTETPLTRALAEEGIPISYNWEVPSGLEQVDQIVFTPAVPKDHPVFELARQKNIPLLKRAAVLGQISRLMPALAVAGTHGKTSVTAVLSVLLQESGLSPLAFIGGVVKRYQSNFLNGTGRWMIAEADEFDRSFLQLSPQSALITAIDPDHLDVYGNAEAFTEGFRDFTKTLSSDGYLVLDEHLRSFGDSLSHNKIIYYGIGAQADVQITEEKHEGLVSTFTYTWGDYVIPNLRLSVPGHHNVCNAAGAITLALIAGVRPEQISPALSCFTGVARRMDIRVQANNVVYIDDYAHHPEEIRAVLTAVRELFPGVYLRVAFQPHLYTRTRDFASGFGQALEMADEVLIADIYPARESSIEGVTSHLIADHMKTVPVRVCAKEQVPQLLMQELPSPSVVMTLGAGDIDRCVSEVERLIQKVA